MEQPQEGALTRYRIFWDGSIRKMVENEFMFSMDALDTSSSKVRVISEVVEYEVGTYMPTKKTVVAADGLAKKEVFRMSLWKSGCLSKEQG